MASPVRSSCLKAQEVLVTEKSDHDDTKHVDVSPWPPENYRSVKICPGDDKACPILTPWPQSHPLTRVPLFTRWSTERYNHGDIQKHLPAVYDRLIFWDKPPIPSPQSVSVDSKAVYTSAIRQANTNIYTLDSEISAVSGVLHELEQRKGQLLQRRAIYENMLGVTRRMPLDLWILIFEILVLEFYGDLWILASVSKEWRDMAIQAKRVCPLSLSLHSC